MGQKVNPLGFRIGITEPHRSTWYAKGENYGSLVAQDYKIRTYIKKNFYQAAIEKIIVERKAGNVIIVLHSARPGIVIGKKGSEIENLTKKVGDIVGDGIKVKVNIIEIRKPNLSAQLMAENVVEQLERRGSFRRAMKRCVEDVVKEGALGCNIKVSGRIGGAEIARTEKESLGSVPMHQLQTKIDYGYATAMTTYGILGVRVWINHGLYKNQKQEG